MTTQADIKGVEMTTQADIKLVIDQLNNLEVVHDYDENVTDDAAQMLAALGNQIAAQAAVIEKLRGALHITANSCQYLGAEKWGIVAKALSTKTDSAQILQEWLDEKLGEPIATKLGTQQLNCFYVFFDDSKRLKELPVGTPLFKKPEIL